MISVTGSGSAAAPPDIVYLSAGVEVTAGSVSAARAGAAADAAAVFNVLESHGVEERNIATTAMSIHPEYDHRDGRRLRGYRVTNTVEARLSDVGRLGAVIDDVAAVGDTVVVNGIRFGHADQADLERRARAAAWDEARRKAGELAALSGTTLGPVRTIEEASHGSVPIPVRAAALETAVVGTPVAGGELGVTVSIEVEFSIEVPPG